jgi:VWFA-related protein
MIFALPLTCLLSVLLQLPEQKRPQFRSGVDLVPLEVVVTDRNHRLITDLAADDFQVLDRGRLQEIADFRRVSLPVRTRDIKTPVPIPLADGLGSNPVVPSDSRRFVLVIDDLHIIEQDIVPVKRLLRGFVEALSGTDYVAMTFVGRSDLSQDFTNDDQLLGRAIDRVDDALGFGLDAMPLGPDAPRPEAHSYARSVSFVLRNISTSLGSGSNARRAIVYVSGGVYLDSGASLRSAEFQQAQDFTRELGEVFDLARRAAVPIYTLDPRGLATPETAVRNPQALTNYAARQEAARRIRIQQDFLTTIAANTGGRAFVNQADAGAAVREIVAENGSYYLLSFYPEPNVPDGRFHNVEVKVRRSDVLVRARAGYVAAKPSDRFVKTRLEDALREVWPRSDVSLKAFAAPVGRESGRTAVALTIEASYTGLGEPGSPLDEEVTVGAVALDSEGRVKGSTLRKLTFRLKVARDGGLMYGVNELLLLEPGTVSLRAGIASEKLGKVGTVHIPLTVPSFTESSPELVGPIVGLGRPTMPIARSDAFGQLLPVQPTAMRSFSVQDVLQVFSRLMVPNQDSSAIKATVGVKRGSKDARTVAATLEARPTERSMVACTAVVSLAGLEVGQYALDVTVTLPDGRILSRSTAFSIH